jgi:hypothetical protein
MTAIKATAMMYRFAIRFGVSTGGRPRLQVMVFRVISQVVAKPKKR